jgi:hypothetical protein
VQLPPAIACTRQARVEVGVLRFLNHVCDQRDEHHIVRMQVRTTHQQAPAAATAPIWHGAGDDAHGRPAKCFAGMTQ